MVCTGRLRREVEGDVWDTVSPSSSLEEGLSGEKDNCFEVQVAGESLKLDRPEIRSEEHVLE